MPIFGAKSRAARGCASKLACGRRIDRHNARPILRYIAANLPLPHGRTEASAPTKRCAVLPKMRAILRLRAAGESAASTPTDVLRCCRLVVRFCDCILRGRGRAPLLRLDLECAKNREKVIPLSRSIHSASSVFFIIVCSGLCLAARKFQMRPNTRGFR